MSRTTDAKKDQVLYVRVDRTLLDRLDAIVSRRRKDQPWRPWSRSDLVRELLWEHLNAEGL